MTFSEILASLPAIDHLEAIELFEGKKLFARIDNKPGSAGSVKVYNALFEEFGEINTDAANKGIELYAQHSEDAKNYPGKHPNIDRLFEVIENDQILTMKLIDAD